MLSTPIGARERLSAQGEYILGVAESLIKHPEFINFLQDIINYLKLSDRGWEYLLHMRRDIHDSTIWKECHPELFRVPNDIINQVDTLRTGEKWNVYRDGILARFSVLTVHARKLSLQIPEGRPTSYASTASSSHWSFTPFSGSEDSARSSISSGYISDFSAHDPSWAMSRGRVQWETGPSKRSVTPSPAAQQARRILEPKRCPACDKPYEKHGNLVRHLRLEHPDHPAAQKHSSGDFKVLSSPGSQPDNSSMGPPSRGSSTTRVALSEPVPVFNPQIIDTAARKSELATQHIDGSEQSQQYTPTTRTESEVPPPVPKKDAPKRPLPYSPTSQAGPREAQEPERSQEDFSVIEDDIDRLLSILDKQKTDDGGQYIDFDALGWPQAQNGGVI